MKKLLKVVGVVIVVLLLVFFAAPLFISPKWEVARARVIPAQPAEIHRHVADFKMWPVWSPFDKDDPAMTQQIDTANSSGVGARRSWKSEKMGNGSQTILREDPAKGVTFELDIEGFSKFESEFVYEAAPGGTKVTWIDRGDLSGNYLHRWFAVMTESMMGPTFEKGLADLETAVKGAR